MKTVKKQQVFKVYKQLFKLYGPQGWWPTVRHGYHKNNYNIPQSKQQQFEIAVGAILTQNTAWTNVELALNNLQSNKLLHPQKILNANETLLKECIRPSGYFNQKAKKLLIFAEFFNKLGEKIPTRDELLALWGVGEETADSILLYAYKIPTFVVDAYTKRMFSHLKIINDSDSYQQIKSKIEEGIPLDLIIYQEFHALIVEHGKQYYSKKPYRIACPLK